MRGLLTLLLAALIGAAAFHIYYRQLAPDARCAWDYPFDDRAKQSCASPAKGVPNYSAKDRAKLDALIDEVR